MLSHSARRRAIGALLCSVVLLSCASSRNLHPGVRFATFNAAMGLAEHGELAHRLENGRDAALHALAEIVQTVRPDVLLLNEFDYLPGLESARLLAENYLSSAHGSAAAIDYPWSYTAPVNTGVDSGLDLDGDGRTGGAADAWGFGTFPGQYGMLVLSRFPLDPESVRSFQEFAWSEMPQAQQPAWPDGRPFYPPDTWSRLRLSSKSHWDLPVHVAGTTVHFLVSHPTPPVFDGEEDRNGRRNHDEIRFWADYVQGGDYHVDDDGRPGALPSSAHFVIAGDQNADPLDGDSRTGAIRQLLEHPAINADCVPRSVGAASASEQQGGINAEHRGDPAADTADFSDRSTGNLRIDYVLPSRTLRVDDCGVFWPAAGEAGHALIEHSDHRMVWVDIAVPQPD